MFRGFKLMFSMGSWNKAQQLLQGWVGEGGMGLQTQDGCPGPSNPAIFMTWKFKGWVGREAGPT